MFVLCRSRRVYLRCRQTWAAERRVFRLHWVLRPGLLYRIPFPRPPPLRTRPPVAFGPV